MQRFLHGRLILALAVLAAFTAFADTSVAAAGSIGGTVTDAVTHEPISGVPVCATVGRVHDEEERFCSQTDAAGGYEVGDLHPGEYAAEFLPGTVGMNYVYEAWEDQHVWVSAEDVTVGDGPVEGIDAELSEGGEVRGTVIDALTGSPVAGVEVCAESKISLYVEEGCATTDLDGRYTIYGLETSSYAIEFWRRPGFLTQYWKAAPDWKAANPVDVVAGEVTESIDAALVPSARISGTVTDAITGAPLADIAACAEPITEPFGECGETDAAGRYTIGGVAPGSYTVRFFTYDPYPPALYTGSLCAEEPAVITVAAGQEAGGIDVQLMQKFFSPDCREPAPPPLAIPLIEVLDIWSRSSGSVAVKLRVRQAGTLSLVARTAIASPRGRRTAVVTTKTLPPRGTGVRIINLGLNHPGRALRRERGRVRARLAITLTPRESDAFSLTSPVLFKAPHQPRR